MEQTKTAEQVLREHISLYFSSHHDKSRWNGEGEHGGAEWHTDKALMADILKAMEAYAAQRPTVAPSEEAKFTIADIKAAHYAGWYNGLVNAYKHQFSWEEYSKSLNSTGEQATPVAEGAGEWKQRLDREWRGLRMPYMEDRLPLTDWIDSEVVQPLQQQVTALQAENREQKLIISSMEDGCEQWQSLCSDLERDVADLKKELFKFSEQNQSLQAENTELRKKCDSKEKTR